MPVPVLVLADTHLGFDLPARPARGDRLAEPGRSRRGEDFFAVFEQAVAPAFAGATDLVLHLGDLFYRSRISAALAARVFARLGDLANAGVDLFWVPGNHERSHVPRGLLLSHPRIHVFDRPRTFAVERAGLRIGLAGMPFSPEARTDFAARLAATGHAEVGADLRLLLLHQAVEGATVGPRRFVFRDAAEVVRCADLRAHAAAFAAVLCGHVHRAQALEHDLAGRRLPMPVLYPGSTERTSSAERDDAKSALWLDIHPGVGGDAPSLAWRRRELPARPMVELAVDPGGGGPALAERLRAALAAVAPRSVVRIRLTAAPGAAALPVLRIASLRTLAPAGVDVAIAWGPWVRRRGPGGGQK